MILGIALAMDAGAVSIANGLKYPKMNKKTILLMSLLFGLFQGGMPLLGYFIGHACLKYYVDYLPWLALVLLGVLGINMLISAFSKENKSMPKLSIAYIFLQALATSIDALSVGLTIAEYTLLLACSCAAIIAGITGVISFLGIQIGKRYGMRLGKPAEIFGGIVLILLGIEIFIKGMML